MSALTVSHILLWIVVVAQAAVILALARQLGVLHERIAPVGALVLNRGLKIGSPVPTVEATNLQGELVRVGGERADGRSTLVLFVSPTCPICKSLLAVVKSTRRQERDWLDLVLASDGELEANREFVRVHGLQGSAYVLSKELGLALQVNRLPFAALVDSAGVLRGRGLINSREHLESLFEAQRTGLSSVQEYFENAAKAFPQSAK
jgi:methylamine dehydrogenase accessory protein MauD